MNKKYIFIITIALIIIILSFLILKKNIIFSIPNNYHAYIGLNEEINTEVTACYGNKILGCKNIKIDVDTIDTSKIGTYVVKYTAQYKGHKKQITSKISVIDKDKPVITTENEEIKICPNQTEYDMKYTAYDNIGGDITPKIIKKTFDDKIALLALDTSYNVTLKTIPIKKEDKEQPTITLKNGNSIAIPVNTTYNEPGYEALDNCDGNITDKVTITGNVDTSKPGNYEITYTVTDTSSNQTTVTRNINVYKMATNQVIYLTFDDGPSKYTSELLDILAKYNVKATFFVTGRNPSYNYNITRAYQEGHSIGLHTNTHNYSTIYSSIGAYFNDLNTISETVKNLTGEYSKLIRFPGGSSNTVSKITPGIMTSLSQLVTEKGYKYFDWNISSGDAEGKVLSSDNYAQNVIKSLGTNPYYVVLQHDTNANSVKAVSKIIEYGQAHGYRFEALNTNSPTTHHKISN